MATGSPDRDPTRTGVNSSDELQELRSGIQWLIFLRLIVTFFLLSVAIFFEIKESKYFSTYPATPIFGLICIIFVLSLCYVGVLGRIKNLRTFSLFQIVTDAVLITIIIYFTGGVSSAFTLLYVFTILAAGILLLRRAAMFVAGVSAVLFGGLATLQFYEILPEYMWPWTSVWRSHDPSYILWVLLIHYAIFFFVALLAGTVAGELKTTRISLTIREHEYERLSDLHTNIIKSIPSGIITTDEHATVTYVNETGARLLGSTPAGLIGSPLASLFPEILSTEGAHDRVNRYQIRKKGLTPEPRDFDVSVGELRDRRNQLLGHLVVFSDVTDIRKMEQRAKQSEKQAAFVRIASGMAHEIRNPLASLRGAAELLRETVGDPLSQQHRLLGIVLREADRLNALLSDFILTVNGRQTHTHTVTLDDFLAKILDDFEETSCRPNAISLKRSILTGENQRIRDLESARIRLREELRERVAMTEEVMQLHAELEKLYQSQAAELRSSEDRYRSLVENSSEGIYRSSWDGKFIEANNAMAYILGYDSVNDLLENLTDLATQLYVNPDDRKRLLNMLLAHGRVNNFEVMCRKKDGSHIWISLNSRLVRDVDGAVLHIEGIFQDISARKEAEQKLSDALEFVQNILATSPAGIVTYSSEGAFVSANEAAEHILSKIRDFDLRGNFRESDFWKRSGLFSEALRVLAQRCSGRTEIRIADVSGGDLWLDCRLASFQTGNGL
ncbi:MAG: PAS domain S-box protein, partial [Desulfomonilaceae bacterium]